MNVGGIRVRTCNHMRGCVQMFLGTCILQIGFGQRLLATEKHKLGEFRPPSINKFSVNNGASYLSPQQTKGYTESSITLPMTVARITISSWRTQSFAAPTLFSSTAVTPWHRSIFILEVTRPEYCSKRESWTSDGRYATASVNLHNVDYDRKVVKVDSSQFNESCRSKPKALVVMLMHTIIITQIIYK